MKKEKLYYKKQKIERIRNAACEKIERKMENDNHKPIHKYTMEEADDGSGYTVLISTCVYYSNIRLISNSDLDLIKLFMTGCSLLIRLVAVRLDRCA